MNIIMVGPPGAGKGTIAELIRDKKNIPILCTGAMIREEIRNKTKFGKEAVEKWGTNEGKLLPDDIVSNFMAESLLATKGGFILDGFPRSIGQATFIEQKGVNIDHVFYMHAEEPTLIKRIVNRRQCIKCKTIYNTITNPPFEQGVCDKDKGTLILRKDDTPEVTKIRLDAYKEKTAALIPYYKAKGNLHTINAERTPKEIFDEIIKIIES